MQVAFDDLPVTAARRENRFEPLTWADRVGVSGSLGDV
jgi:hypothetical protein